MNWFNCMHAHTNASGNQEDLHDDHLCMEFISSWKYSSSCRENQEMGVSLRAETRPDIMFLRDLPFLLKTFCLQLHNVFSWRFTPQVQVCFEDESKSDASDIILILGREVFSVPGYPLGSSERLLFAASPLFYTKRPGLVDVAFKLCWEFSSWLELSILVSVV